MKKIVLEGQNALTKNQAARALDALHIGIGEMEYQGLRKEANLAKQAMQKIINALDVHLIVNGE